MENPQEQNAIQTEEEYIEDHIPDEPEQQSLEDDYDIEEPDDDLGTNDIKIPVIKDDEKQEKKHDTHEKVDDNKKDEKLIDKKIKKDEAEKQTTDEQQQEKPQKPELPEDLVKKAKDAGFKDDDISEFSQSQLEKALSVIESKTTAEQKPDKQQPAEKAKAEYSGDEFKLEFDEDLFDPDIIQAMKSTADQINGIKAKLNSVLESMTRQSAAEFEREFDGMVNQLGDEFSDVFGQGDGRSLDRESEQFQNRVKLIDEMATIVAGYQQTGKALPSRSEVFQRAVNSVFGDRIKTNARRSISQQLDRRASQIIARPTNKDAGKSSQSPERRAISAVQAKLREYGVDMNADVEDF